MTYERKYKINGIEVNEKLVLDDDDEIASFLYLYFYRDKKRKMPIKNDEVRTQVDWKDVDFAKCYKACGGDE